MKNTTKKIQLTWIILFPFLITILTEYNHLQNLRETLTYITSNFSVYLFSTIFIILFFILLISLFKDSFYSITIISLICYILSTVEYFKYTTSGTHFTLSDLAMTKNISDVGKFADLNISAPLVLNFIIILIYLIVSYKFRYKFNLKKRQAMGLSVSLTTLLCFTVAIPSTSSQVYGFFKIENYPATNVLENDELFRSNGFLGLLSQTTTSTINNKTPKPLDYSEQKVLDILNKNESDYDQMPAKKPNVIFIMSESFGDFRDINNTYNYNNAYDYLDKVSNKSFKGSSIVPTFGGYTARTEFELIFGLPVYSLNTPSVPYTLLSNKENYDTIPKLYKNIGYSTTYIHPFSRTFYSRGSIFKNLGFDNLIFEDNLPPGTELFKKYTDDNSVFELIKNTLSESSESDYIFTTTMQNHQPYFDTSETKSNELEYYLEGIENTSESLYELINFLETFNEDTILVFLGDHFPFFTPEENIYENLGLNDNNINSLYKQNYYIYNNFNADFSKYNEVTLSSFYIPYIILESMGYSSNSFINTMLLNASINPIYSPNIQFQNSKDQLLDILTYDRILGENYSQDNIQTAY